MIKRQSDHLLPSTPNGRRGIIPAVLLSLAMAIGINAAIFSDWQRLILRPSWLQTVENDAGESEIQEGEAQPLLFRQAFISAYGFTTDRARLVRRNRK